MRKGKKRQEIEFNQQLTTIGVNDCHFGFAYTSNYTAPVDQKQPRKAKKSIASFGKKENFIRL